ncbi:cellulose synthase [Phyllobacterium ifriqiyense]|uniref:cellulose synthase n=1 Tax=Phyllobacterium ifriqiyense TaxID=314238 RepID=UPI0033929798
MKKTILFLIPTLGAIAAFSALQQNYFPVFGAANSSVRFNATTERAVTAGAYDVAQTDASVAATGGSAASQVDETALRYFARQGDKRRLAAEIARLRALYPNWTPPADPTATAPVADGALDEIWKLYSSGKLSEARKAIQEKQNNGTQWQPPADLLARLDLAEAREALINASDLKQYDAVVRLGSSNTALLTCDDVDSLWRVAEAFAQTNRTARAADAYAYILDNCAKPEERLATIQKALPQLSQNEIDGLLKREKQRADGTGEFDTIRDDLARKAIGAAGEDAKILVPQADLVRVEKLARDIVEPSDPLILGWYYFTRGDVQTAEKWFKLSHDRAKSASASQGLALAMIAQSRFAEAERVIYEWRDNSDNARAVYMAAVANLLAQDPPVEISPVVLRRIVPEVMLAKDANAAQQLGWYAYLLNQFETASGWFSTALQWKPDDEPSAYGLVLARQQMGDLAQVAAIQKRWAGRSERIALLGEPNIGRSQQLMPMAERFGEPIKSETKPAELQMTTAALPGTNRIGSLPPSVADRVAATLGQATALQAPLNSAAGSSRTTLEARRRPASAARQPLGSTGMMSSTGCSTTVNPETLTPESALPRGWCLMELKRPLEAAAAFERALLSNSESSRSDAAYGQSLAYLRAGLSDKAAIAASKARQKQSRQLELQIALLSAKATEAFNAGRMPEAVLALDQRARIAPERTDLMVLRGYAYMRMQRLSDAMRIFEAVAATGDKEGLRGISAVNSARRRDY